MPTAVVASVVPTPTEEEAAAIAAAVDLLWPGATDDDPTRRPQSAWKFSGRWWTQPIPLRRARPWT
jgi:hypothetical protein